jgi:hypothetical protein
LTRSKSDFLIHKGVLRLFLIFVLVASVFAVASTGTVAAYQAGDYLTKSEKQDADLADGLYTELRDQCDSDGPFDFAAVVFDATNPCYVVRDAVVETQTTGNYAADNIKTDAKADLNSASNYSEELLDDALDEAMKAYSKAVANGKDKSTAQLKADNAATEFVAMKMKNRLVGYNEKTLNRIQGLAEASGVTVKSYAYDSGQTQSVINGTTTFNRTLFPQSNASLNFTFTALKGEKFGRNHSLWYGAGSNSRIYDIPNGELVAAYDSPSTAAQVTYSSDDYNSKQIAVDQQKFMDTWRSYKNTRAEAVTEIENFGSSLSQSEYENLNASDVLDARQLAQNWGQKYNATNSSGYAAALAAQAGLSVSENLSTTYAVNYTATDHIDHTGVIFGAPSAWDATNGSIETGYVYNGSAQSAFVLPTGATSKVPLDQKYTVERIELRSGKIVNSTPMRDWSTGNAFVNLSQFRSNLDAYQELMNQTAELPDSRASGGGLLGSGSTLVGLVLGILVLFMLVGGKEMFGDTVSNTLDRRAKSRRFQKKQNAKMRRTAYKEKKKDERRDD